MKDTGRHRAHNQLASLTSELALPPASRSAKWGQSLAKGAPGIALLHVERAAAGLGDRDDAHAWLAASMRSPVLSTPGTGLFFGAPAVAFAVHSAATGPGDYSTALAALDATVARMTAQRLEDGHARIDRGQKPIFAEYDLIYGLTGLAVLLRRRDPHGALLRDVLRYLVRLTEPLPGGVPGWWTDVAPTGDLSPHYPTGHGNVSIAHGITGPLALLSLTLHDGTDVPGQREAIRRITDWLDTWQQNGPRGPWWPEAITEAEVRRGHPRQTGPLRPSWCYGTPGIARAQQLAALATGDQARQDAAEHAITAALEDPAQTAQLTDSTLCHGSAGVLLTARRIAADCRTPATAARLLECARALTEHAPNPAEPGLLEGAAGTALGLHAAALNALPASGWDACLLLT